MEAIYIPGGAFGYLLVTVGLALVAAVAFLALFTDAALLP